MVFTHDTTINPMQIILKSNQGRQKNGSMKSSLSFELNQTILVPNNVDCYIQLESLKFVNSFYKIMRFITQLIQSQGYLILTVLLYQ